MDDDVDLDALARLTDGYSGADISVVCRDAAMMSVRRVMKSALEKGLSGPEIQKHIMEMKDELAAAVTMEDFRCSLQKASGGGAGRGFPIYYWMGGDEERGWEGENDSYIWALLLSSR